jgi:hypothetical protein
MNMTKNNEQKLRFSSKKTGISITLPIGWYQESQTGTEYPTDIYFQSLGEPYSPYITIKVIQLPEVEYHENSYQELSEVLLKEQAQYSALEPLEMLEQRLENINHHPARIDIFNFIEKETKIPVTQYQLTLQLDMAVCGLIAIMKTEDKDYYLPVFNEAVQTIEFKGLLK